MSLILVLYLAILSFTLAENPIVRIDDGFLKGISLVSTKGRPYSTFYGIPYARPPVGNYRFKAPVKNKPWKGIWDATKIPEVCIQYQGLRRVYLGTEDCLYINVHTPRLEEDALLPVLVFIHSGMFFYSMGARNGPDRIMNKDIVLVTFNFRLGLLGFLSTEDSNSPGNNGLKDQALALHWVQNNIKMFGGDPSNVTIGGGMSGGASVSYHLLSPLSKNTFSKAIAISGSAYCPWAFIPKPLKRAKAVAAVVGCPTKNTKDLVSCLKSRPAMSLTEAHVQIMGWRVPLFSIFGPVMEPADTPHAFITEHPYAAGESGAMMPVPLLLGFAGAGGLYPAAVYYVDQTILTELEENWKNLASHVLIYNDTYPVSRRGEVADRIKKYYFKDEPISIETFNTVVKMLSGRLYRAGIAKLARLHADKTDQPTFMYEYNYRGALSTTNFITRSDVNIGVMGLDDIIRVFKFEGLNVTTAEDMDMSEKLINAFYTFASTGKPQLTEEKHDWFSTEPNSDHLDYLEILSPTVYGMKFTKNLGQVKFWDSLGFNENENYKPTSKP